MTDMIFTIAQPLLFLASAPLFLGIVRRAKARFQNRIGASVFQPYWALLSLLEKDMTVPEWSSWVYHAVPRVVFGVAIVLAFLIPAFGIGIIPAVASNIFFVSGMLAIGAVFLVMGGMDTGSTFGNMGSSREMTLASIIEPTLFLSLATLGALAGSWNISSIVTQMAIEPWANFIPAAFALLALVFVALLENARYPVDNPATHLELTMVHEATVLEYSGPYLAMLEYASMIKLAALSLLVMNLALPFQLALPGAALPTLAAAFGFFWVKFIFAAVAIALIESVVVKMRFYRMQEYAMYAFLIAAVGFIVLIALHR